MNRQIIRIAVAASVLPMLAGCHIYQKFDIEKQDSNLAKEYARAAEQPAPETLGNTRWEVVFTDPLLQDYIRQALAQNADLENARLNVEVAHANLRGARMAYFPSLSLGAQASSSNINNFKVQSWSYSVPLQASWEVDLFGKLLNNKRSASANYEMTQDYAQAVRSQIIGAVANCYYAIGALRSQIRLSEETAEIWKKNVETMRDYKLIGRTNEAAIMQAEANYLSILANLQDLRHSLVETNNSLALLLHKMPQEFPIGELNFAPPTLVLNGIALEQLAARPDVRAAEKSLAVAYYATNSARSAFYPGLTLSAGYTFTNTMGTIVKNPGEFISSLVGSITAPLFSRGQNIARLQATKAQQKQALNSFEKTLLSAASEVSNALTAYESNVEKQKHLTAQVEDLTKASEYTKDLYSMGDASYLEMLTAQSSLLSAQMSLINCELAQAQSVINLYQSLGGGRE